jgi:hypothetical protein
VLGALDALTRTARLDGTSRSLLRSHCTGCCRVGSSNTATDRFRNSIPEQAAGSLNHLRHTWYQIICQMHRLTKAASCYEWICGYRSVETVRVCLYVHSRLQLVLLRCLTTVSTFGCANGV